MALILYVDAADLPDDLTVRQLERAGHVVCTANTAADARRVCGVLAHDLMLMGIPPTDEPARLLVADLTDGGTPVLVYSLDARPADVAASLACGATALQPRDNESSKLQSPGH